MPPNETSIPMSSRFKDKLKQIRDASQKRSEISQKERSEEDLHRSEKTVRAFEFRERVEEVIEELVKNFQQEAPGFVLTRGFYEGKYMLALRLDEQLQDPAGQQDQYFSRVMFLLDPNSEDVSFGVQCRKTIRNRDVETTSHRGPMDREQIGEFSDFIEAQFIAFAEAYFGDTTLTRPASVPTG